MQVILHDPLQYIFIRYMETNVFNYDLIMTGIVIW
jgi:hypothetical protein